MSRGAAYFTIRLKSSGMSPELAYKHARQCEQLLRDRAPAGIEIDALEFHGSKFSPGTAEFSRRVRAAMRETGERECEERRGSGLERAAALAREEIEVL